MRKSTIPFLIIKVATVALAVSCASDPIKGYSKTAVEIPVYNAVYFADPKIDYVYKTNISVYGNELSGIFIAKKISETAHRVVFTTEFGNKLLDFEIADNDFKINSIVDELNKKLLINTLRDDFRLMLQTDFMVLEQYENTSENVYKSQNGKLFNYIFVSKSNQKLLKIALSSKRKQKLYVSYESENNIFAERIIIQHQNIDLKIEFNYFKPDTIIR